MLRHVVTEKCKEHLLIYCDLHDFSGVFVDVGFFGYCFFNRMLESFVCL